LFAYLRSVVVPTAVYAATSDWGAVGNDGPGLTERIDRAAGELATLMSTARSSGPSDPFDAPTPFEELLAGRS